jgi:hypothetical protein
VARIVVLCLFAFAANGEQKGQEMGPTESESEVSVFCDASMRRTFNTFNPKGVQSAAGHWKHHISTTDERLPVPPFCMRVLSGQTWSISPFLRSV